MSKHTCPTCGAPCEMTYSGLDLVEQTGDETLAFKHYRFNANLVEAASKLLEAMEQKQFFMSGYAQGSASISEVNNASDEEHKAYSELWNILHELKKS